MLVEVKILIVAPELTSAINNLVAAINSKASQAQSVSASQSGVSAPVTVAPSVSSATQIQAASAQPSIPVTPAASVPQPAIPVASVPLANAPQFTVDQIMAAGATLMDAGKVDDLLNLLHSFGVQAVMDLKPEQLGAFATEMRKLGAAI